MKQTRIKKHLLKWGPLGIAFIFVLVYSWSLLAPRLGNQFSQDSYGYFLLGKNLINGLGFTSPSARDFNVEPTWPVVGKSFPPFYPLLVGVTEAITGLGIRSNAALNIVILAVFIGVLIAFFRRQSDWAWPITLCAFVLFISTNPHYREEVLAGRSIPTMMLGLFGFHAAFAVTMDRTRRLIIAEVCAGVCLAIMMHSRFDQTLFCLGVMPLSFILYRWHGDKNGMALKKTGTLFGAFLLASLPWMVRNTLRFGFPFASDNSVAVFSTYPSLVGICYWPAGAEPDTIWTNFELWADQRWRYLLANLKKIMDVTSYLICWVPFVPVLIWRILTNKQRFFYLFACLHILCTIASISISPYGDLRYFSAIHFHVLVIGFMCGAAVLDLAVVPLVEKTLPYVALAIIVVLPFMESSRTPIADHLLKGHILPGNVENHKARYEGMKRAFAPHLTPDPIIAVHHDAEIFTYYTGYRTIYYPLNLKRRTKGLAEWIEIWQVEYLVLFSRMVPKLGLGPYALATAGGRTLVDARAFTRGQGPLDKP